LILLGVCGPLNEAALVSLSYRVLLTFILALFDSGLPLYDVNFLSFYFIDYSPLSFDPEHILKIIICPFPHCVFFYLFPPPSFVLAFTLLSPLPLSDRPPFSRPFASSSEIWSVPFFSIQAPRQLLLLSAPAHLLRVDPVRYYISPPQLPPCGLSGHDTRFWIFLGSIPFSAFSSWITRVHSFDPMTHHIL